MARPSIAMTTLPRAVVCAALTMSMLAGCHRTPTTDSLLADATQYRQRGETRAAIIQLKNALQQEPDNVRARALLGQVYLDAGDPLSAEKELRKAQMLGMKRAEILPPLAKAMLMLGQAERVLAEMTLDPAEEPLPELLALRANAYLASGKTEQARQLFEQILTRRPGFGAALLGLARIAVASNQAGQAGALLQQALADNPDDIDSLQLNGDLLRLRGNNDAARLAYARILKVRPDHIQAHIDLANLDLQAGKFADAHSQIDAARKSAPNSVPLLHAQALLDFREGKHKVARDLLQKILAGAPGYMPSILLMSTVQIALGSPQQAEQYLRRFLEANPKHLYASKMLAATALGSGQPDAVIEIVKPLLKTNPDDVELLALAGEAHMQARRFAKASEYFQKASELLPEAATLHTALAASQLGTGENARAIAELERANALDAKSPRAGIMLVMTHLQAKENARALAVVKTMEQQQGANPLLQNLKGGVLLSMQDMKAARASFEQALGLDPAYLPAMRNLAQLDLAEKQPEHARQRFESALAKDPKNAALMAELAKLATLQNKPAEALRWLERASKDNPEALAPAALLSNAYLKMGEKQKALTLAQKLQAGNPGNSDALALLAHVQNDSGDWAAALESYTKLATLQPRSAALQMRISSLRVALNDQAGALQAVRKALSLEPGLLAAQGAEAALLMAKGNHAEALAVAQSVQKQHPDLADGFKLEGDLLMTQNKPLAALKLYEQALSKKKANGLLINMHQALTMAGRTEQAAARINAWLQQNPGDLAARFYIASSDMARKQYQPAIEQFEKIVAQDPNNVAALNNLAVAYQQSKDRRALATAQRVYQLQERNPAVIDTLGWIVLESGDIGRALPLLKKAAELAPEVPDIQYHLGAALVKAGDKQGARVQLERALAIKKDFPSRAEVQALLTQL